MCAWVRVFCVPDIAILVGTHFGVIFFFFVIKRTFRRSILSKIKDLRLALVYRLRLDIFTPIKVWVEVSGF